MRYLLYLDLPDKHRVPIYEGLAVTLQQAGHDVRIVAENGQYVRYGETLTAWRCDAQLNSLTSRLGSTVTKIESFKATPNPREEHLARASAIRAKTIPLVLEKYQPDKIIVFNGSFHYQSELMEAIRLLRWSSRLIFLEMGWFPQSEYVYFDEQGVNAASSIVGMEMDALSPAKAVRLMTWKSRYLNRRMGFDQANFGAGTDIIVPLQVDTDTAIALYSPFGSMREFIQYLEDWIPSDRNVVIKAHPKAIYSYHLSSRRPNFRFACAGSVYNYFSEAELVVGVNSTVLMEAALVGLPVVAFGRGLFSGNNVVYECSIGEPFPEKIKVDAIDRDAFFYELVFNRQVSKAKLALGEATHLYSRTPFSRFDCDNVPRDKLFAVKSEEGKAMIKVGSSKVAKSASLDVTGEGAIYIGDGCEIRHNAVLEVVGRYNGIIKIGNRCVIGISNWLQGAGGITIEDDVIIGPYTCLVSSNHTYDDPNEVIAKQPLKLGAINVKTGAWLGANVTVSYGVTIGEHAIVGANSFVNKDVPPYSVVVGSPARVARMRK